MPQGELVGFPSRLVLLDCETTGGNAIRDRMTEIALIQIDDGVETGRWQSLINPARSIPPWITRITGISDSMVAEAPSFAEIAECLLEKLQGRVVVAHNARFDYGFLVQEFKRVNISYSTKPLCSVKVSRHFYPQYRRHNLDSIIERLNVQVDARHRAMADTDVILRLFQTISQQFDRMVIEAGCSKLLKHVSLPAQLDAARINELPTGPGVYRFYGADNNLLYIGKSISIRERVLSHFSLLNPARRALELSQQTTRIEYTETLTDFSAQLLENFEIKQYAPTFNRKQRRIRTLYQLQKMTNASGFDSLTIVKADLSSLPEVYQRFGLFRSKAKAVGKLRELSETHALCHQLIGLEKISPSSCFAYQIKRCAGACCGKESATIHNLRINSAMVMLRNKIWPWSGPITVTESALVAGRVQKKRHLVDQWVYLGEASHRPESSQQFDLDAYHILIRFLLSAELRAKNNLVINPINRAGEQYEHTEELEVGL